MGRDVDGDDFEAAFERLFLIAFRIAYRILGQVPDAEDVASETLARTLVAWRRIGGQPYEEAWVARVASNRSIDVLRRAEHVPVRPQPDREQVDPAEVATLRVALVVALKALSRRQRQVIALRYLAGLNEGEVAACLGISRNSVKKHAARAVSSLRDRLGTDWQEVKLALD